MNLDRLLQYLVFLACLTLLVKPFGSYMARLFQRQSTFFDRIAVPVEQLTYKLCGIDPEQQMNWKEYAAAFVWVTLTGTVFLYAVFSLQTLLPWFYPKYMTTPMTPDLALNTALSFVTTTTWQAYGGETTLSYTSQMLALVTGNFLGGAAGMAVGMAFIRGFSNSKDERLGNFYVDFFRALYWVLLPLSFLGSLVLISQGTPMNFHPYTAAVGMEGQPQIIAQGPVAVLEIIKNLGTNGGGFFNVNGAHPYANPTPLTNFIGMLAIAVLPAALTYTFGSLTGRKRDGWTLYILMSILFSIGIFFCDYFESQGNPMITEKVHLSQPANLEGKEVRFGIAQSVLAAVITSNTSTGSYNSMHDSYTPLGGMVPLVDMLIGQFIFGGLGGGLYGIVLWVLITMFVVGLMVGRTPEYLGEKIGPQEMKLVALYILVTPLTVLILSAVAVVAKDGLAGLTTNVGPHGATSIVYAYASCNANNGQNFAGLSANSLFYNLTTAIAMLTGRFGLAIPVLALAGRFALQPTRNPTQGTMPSDTPTFAMVFLATVFVIGALSYFPVLILGPVVEHLLMGSGRLF
jgi:potassium-transporting ATPase potassium-binding subunit